MKILLLISLPCVIFLTSCSKKQGDEPQTAQGPPKQEERKEKVQPANNTIPLDPSLDLKDPARTLQWFVSVDKKIEDLSSLGNEIVYKEKVKTLYDDPLKNLMEKTVHWPVTVMVVREDETVLIDKLATYPNRLSYFEINDLYDIIRNRRKPLEKPYYDFNVYRPENDDPKYQIYCKDKKWARELRRHDNVFLIGKIKGISKDEPVRGTNIFYVVVTLTDAYIEPIK